MRSRTASIDAVGHDRGTGLQPGLQHALDVALAGHAEDLAGRTCVRLEGGAHGAMGMVESGAGRAGRDRQRLGDLARLQARVVAQDEDGALLRWQAPEAPLELVAVAHVQVVVRGGRDVYGKDREVGDAAASRAPPR